MSKPITKGQLKATSIRIPDELYGKLMNDATVSYRHVTQQILMILTEYYKQGKA